MKFTEEIGACVRLQKRVTLAGLQDDVADYTSEAVQMKERARVGTLHELTDLQAEAASRANSR